MPNVKRKKRRVVFVVSICRKKNHSGFYNVFLEPKEKAPKCPPCYKAYHGTNGNRP